MFGQIKQGDNIFPVLKWALYPTGAFTKAAQFSVKCRAVEFYNTGNTTAVLNGFHYISAGTAKVFTDFYRLSIFEQDFEISFLDNAPEGMAASNRLEVTESRLKNFDYKNF